MNEDHTLVKPFIDAAVDTLGTMAMLDLECNTVGFVDRFEETLDYTATMGLCGEHEGLQVSDVLRCDVRLNVEVRSDQQPRRSPPRSPQPESL